MKRLQDVEHKHKLVVQDMTCIQEKCSSLQIEVDGLKVYQRTPLESFTDIFPLENSQSRCSEAFTGWEHEPSPPGSKFNHRACFIESKCSLTTVADVWIMWSKAQLRGLPANLQTSSSNQVPGTGFCMTGDIIHDSRSMGGLGTTLKRAPVARELQEVRKSYAHWGLPVRFPFDIRILSELSL